MKPRLLFAAGLASLLVLAMAAIALLRWERIEGPGALRRMASDRGRGGSEAEPAPLRSATPRPDPEPATARFQLVDGRNGDVVAGADVAELPGEFADVDSLRWPAPGYRSTDIARSIRSDSDGGFVLASPPRVLWITAERYGPTLVAVGDEARTAANAHHVIPLHAPARVRISVIGPGGRPARGFCYAVAGSLDVVTGGRG